MSDTKNGGTAFPKLSQDTRWGTFTSTDGISVRDYFAAKAMQGMLASCTGWSEQEQKRLAKCSYMMADEMLKAREE